ncbi:hypothetical protein D3C75_1005160 [compost metagenome]
MHRQQAGTAATSPRVQLHPQQSQCINTQTHCPRGKPRLIIQQEALRPFGALTFCGAGRAGTQAMLITKVFIEVDIAQLQLQLAVVDEIAGINHGNREYPKER